MSYVEYKLWVLGIGVLVVFVAHFLYRLFTGKSLGEAGLSESQERQRDR